MLTEFHNILLELGKILLFFLIDLTIHSLGLITLMWLGNKSQLKFVIYWWYSARFWTGLMKCWADLTPRQDVIPIFRQDFDTSGQGTSNLFWLLSADSGKTYFACIHLAGFIKDFHNPFQTCADGCRLLCDGPCHCGNASGVRQGECTVHRAQLCSSLLSSPLPSPWVLPSLQVSPGWRHD